MANGIFIERHEFTQLMKRIAFLEEYVKNSLKQSGKSKWVSQEEAMDLLGCKNTKLKTLRLTGALEWKTSGNGRNVMVSRKSIEEYNLNNSNQLRRA